jgi:hypothetical protein
MPRDPFPDWQTEGAVQILEHYLALAQCGSTLGLAFVGSVVMDVFCEMVEADADRFRALLEGKQVTIGISERERELLGWDEERETVTLVCEFCGAEFESLYKVHYCPRCEDFFYGDAPYAVRITNKQYEMVYQEEVNKWEK